jgi:hypothetical protein
VNSTLRAAHEDHDSVVKLTRELVRIPSRGGVDPYDQVLDYMSGWLGSEHALGHPGESGGRTQSGNPPAGKRSGE